MHATDGISWAQSGQWQTLKAALRESTPQGAYEWLEMIGAGCPLTLSFDGCVESADDVLGLTIAGALLRSVGHRYRGSRSADETSETQFERYYSYLVQAKNALEQALNLDRHNGLAAAVYMLISTDPVEDGQKEIAEARLLDARNVPLAGYMNLLKANLEKWGGSHEDMFRIARSRLGKDPPLQSALIAYAHVERELFYSMFDESPEAAQLAKQYYQGAVLDGLRTASQIILKAHDVDPAEQKLADSWMIIALTYGGETKLALRHLRRQKGYKGGAWLQIGNATLFKFILRLKGIFV